jgi:predicted enzyme related to lactoylglutathione lyase
MGTRDSYEAGTFSWVELATSDADGAKRFYGELFGWDYEDNEVGEGQTYSMATRDGHHVAGLFGSDQAPPHWTSYVTVRSAEDAAAHAEETGGNVMAEAFDVMDAGRMAVIQDPQGAVFAVWEPKEHPGARLVNSPGSLTWNDLMTSDVAEAAKFYCDMFNWEVAEMEGAPDERMVIRNGERLNGGIAKLPESMDEVPPHWIPYFAVDDADQSAGRIGELGGKVMVEPIEIPAGRLAVASDPQGAVFAIFSGELED